MSFANVPGQGERRMRCIHVGEVCTSRQPVVVRTLLGSCIAVCLRDPVARAGGMNHFLLPAGGQDGDMSARYGVHAMELLINGCMQQGASRNGLEAKVFGGGHVLHTREAGDSVPQSNVRFIMEFLATENIPVRSQNVGGYAGREVYFFTDTGRVLLKHLSGGSGAHARELAALEQAERAHLRRPAAPPPPDAGSITLF